MGGRGKPQNACITSKGFSKEELFVGQRYRRMEDQKPWPASGT